MKKRAFSFVLTLFLIISILPASVFSFAFSGNTQSGEGIDSANAVLNAANVTRYTVLVIDISAASNFLDSDGNIFYTAGTAIEYIKTAAKKFIEGVASADGTNYIAVVTYRGSYVSKFSDFTVVYQSLINAIDKFTASENTRNVSLALESAHDLIDTVTDPDAIKNVVLFTTGVTNTGGSSYIGQYDQNTVGSSWRRTDTQINLYAYANSAYEEAESLKTKASLYTIGLFQTMDNMPAIGQDAVQFFRLCAKDWATSLDHFYDVTDPNDLEYVFGSVAGDLLKVDSDGDGLPNDWEINGVDTDGDGMPDLMLNLMGADPLVPDVFVEVDWMIEPSSSVLWVGTSQETSLAPSEASMRIVYESFKKHGINIHIDVGPDSIDFVTGNKWGSLSGGNVVQYLSDFDLGAQWEHWNSAIAANFTPGRANIFKHCLFVNTYNGDTSSGLANNIPGQYFIIANQEWLRTTGDIGIAGTFMHELGHTLGLCHGGHTSGGGEDHTNYKPNYLSIMNYLFQVTGLVGTDEITYSEYKLPDLDENSLDELAGLDPAGLTLGTSLGSRLILTHVGGEPQSVSNTPPIANTSIDFNSSMSIDSNPVSVDLNVDGNMTVLTSSVDWGNLYFKGGQVGKNTVYIAGVSKPSDQVLASLEEATVEEFIDAGALGNKGAGAIDGAGPFTVLAGEAGQSFYIRVSNLTAEKETFKLTVDSGSLTVPFSADVTVDASISEIKYVDIPVPLVSNPKPGEHTIIAKLSYPDRQDIVKNISVDVYNPSQAELNALQNAIANGELEGLLPADIINQYDQYTQVETNDSILLNGEETGLTLNADGSVTVNAANLSGHKTPVLLTMPFSGQSNTYVGIKKNNNLNSIIPFSICQNGDIHMWISQVGTYGGIDNKKSFPDTVGHWASDYIDFVGARELFTGNEKGEFVPNGSMTRAMFCRVMANLDGISQTLYTSSQFTDVPDGTWYTSAVEWAARVGIVSGVGNGRFSPNTYITREQMATMLNNYMIYKGMSLPELGSASAFSDETEISSWAFEAVKSMQETGIINGKPGGIYDPKSTAARSEAAAIFTRLIQTIS